MVQIYNIDEFNGNGHSRHSCTGPIKYWNKKSVNGSEAERFQRHAKPLVYTTID